MSVPYEEKLKRVDPTAERWSDLAGIESGNPYDGSGEYAFDVPDGHTWNTQIDADPRWFSTGAPKPFDPSADPVTQVAQAQGISEEQVIHADLLNAGGPGPGPSHGDGEARTTNAGGDGGDGGGSGVIGLLALAAAAWIILRNL